MSTLATSSLALMSPKYGSISCCPSNTATSGIVTILALQTIITNGTNGIHFVSWEQCMTTEKCNLLKYYAFEVNIRKLSEQAVEVNVRESS